MKVIHVVQPKDDNLRHYNKPNNDNVPISIYIQEKSII